MAKREKPTTATPGAAVPPETPKDEATGVPTTPPAATRLSWNPRQWLDAALDMQRRETIALRELDRRRQELEHDLGLQLTNLSVQFASLDAATAATYGPLDRIFVRRLYADVLHRMRPELVSPAADEEPAIRRYLFQVTFTADEYAVTLSTQSGIKEFPPEVRAALIGGIRRRILKAGGTVTAHLLAIVLVARLRT